MKRTLLIFLIFCGISSVFAQSDPPDTAKVNLDILKAPSSPAFNLMELSPSEIERPTDVSAFALSLQNSTKNFSSLPNSYAVELAPVYLFQKKLITLNQFDTAALKQVFWQSLVLSVGYTHVGPEGKEDIDSLRRSKLGVGIKFSLIRPRFSKQTESVYRNLVEEQSKMMSDYLNFEKNASLEKQADSIRNLMKKISSIYNTGDAKGNLERLRLKAQLNDLNKKINEEGNLQLSGTQAFEAAKKIATNFKIERIGPFLDFAAGLTLDFPDDRFDNSLLTKGGAWLTGGYENGNKGLTIMGIARYLFQPDRAFADDHQIIQSGNISTFDAGGRLLYNGYDGRLVLSAEIIYRSLLNSSLVDPSWRLVFNTEYDIGKNKKLTFAFGRNFDGVMTKGGNLIAALNFITAFGSAKKISK